MSRPQLRRPSMNPIGAAMAVALPLLLACAPAHAADINILWYTYSDPASTYRSELLKVAAQAATDPLAHGNQWHITWWDAGTAIPANLAGFDVLVTHSGEGFLAAKPGEVGVGPVESSRYPDFSTLLASGAAIQSARGDRTAIIGTDLDLHSVVRASGINPSLGLGCTAQNTLGSPCDPYDGARGMLTNVIDWAGAGNGLAVVALFDGEFLPGGYWWAKPGSFLREELQGTYVPFYATYPRPARDDLPFLTATEAVRPLADNLSTTGLSNWFWSAHGGFSSLPTGYVSGLESSKYPGTSVMLISAATADRGFTSAVPEPTPALLLLAGLAGLAWRRRNG